MHPIIAVLLCVGSASALPRDAIKSRQTTPTSYIQFGSKCQQDVYFEVFENTAPGVTGGLIDSGTLYNQVGFQSQEVNYGEQNLGISIKASFLPNPSSSGPVLQFEVDKNVTANSINYDISAVNGDPFLALGSSMYVDDPNGGCYNIECPAGDDSCAFQFPEDNTKDHGCGGLDHIVYAQVCDVE